MSDNPKISIITVVFNDVKHLEETILSVLNQSYTKIEYILIDGGSIDGTMEIIKKYSNRLAFWTSERDGGIYDAMNKGLKAATGDFVLFLNSGDKIYSEDLFSKIDGKIDDVWPDVIYGETMIIAENGSEIGLRRLKAPESLNWRSLRDGMIVCHQSFLVRRTITPPYNLNYKFAADFDWMINILKRTDNTFNSNHIISAFLEGGTSKKNIRTGLIERFFIMKKNYGFWPTFFRHILIIIRFFRFYTKNKRF